ncbi:hypothetical protein [Deinococcus carri]
MTLKKVVKALAVVAVVALSVAQAGPNDYGIFKPASTTQGPNDYGIFGN